MFWGGDGDKVMSVIISEGGGSSRADSCTILCAMDALQSSNSPQTPEAFRQLPAIFGHVIVTDFGVS